MIEPLVAERINRVLTQYRESPRLLGMITAYLTELAEAIERADAIPAAFDIDTSEGDQLTKIGQWLGFPRVQAKGQRVKAFGFERPSLPSITYPVAGFCDSRFLCAGNDFEAKAFDDDAEYRRFLKARAVAVNAALSGRYDREVLTDAASALLCDEVLIVEEGEASITLCLTRFYTDAEKSMLHLAAQVMPLPLGVRLFWAHCDGVPFGFGMGWGEMCNSSFYGVIRETVTDQAVSDAFGFGPGFSGFCSGRFFPQS